MKKGNGIGKKKVNFKSKKVLIYSLIAIVLIAALAIYYIVRNNSEDHKNEDFVALKPMIYLYPEEEKLITVTLLAEEKLTVTYPKYDNGWEVIAKPNGDLLDIKTNRNLYGLYWEGLNTVTTGMKDYGFVVKGSDSISFLEEKLAILGLNEMESNEFIVYWLPKLQKNKFNYIRFATTQEINENMPLDISPKPDTIIRINMEYKKLDEYIDIKEQKLVTKERIGFVVVEWGGTIIK